MNSKAVQVVDALVVALQADLDSSEHARQNSQNDANEAEGRMLTRYDTRKDEAQFLAGGHTKRSLILTQAIGRLLALKESLHETALRVVLGSIVYLSTEEAEQMVVFIAPEETGGRKVQVGSQSILSVSVQTPLAVACIKKGVDDEVVFNQRKWKIDEIE